MRILRALLVLSGALPLACSADNYTLNPYAVDAPLRVPVISILTPDQDGEGVDASYTIKVAFEKVVVDDTWTLYYISNATPNKGAAIGQDLPVTARTLVWDTSLMPAGHYFLYGELKSLDGVITASAPGSIIVDHPVEDGNTSPVVALVSPNGGEVITPGTTQTVTWSGSDPDGLTFKLELSKDYGNTWADLAADLTGLSYDWAVPADQTVALSYMLRITATDAKTAASVDLSDRPFTIQ